MPESLTPLLERIDRVVVLTLPEAQQRQAMVKHLLAGVGLPFEFHFGRDCRQSNLNDLIEAGDYDPLARRRAGRPDLTPGEIGCALSHRAVQSKVQPGERVLILEDDIRVIPGRLAGLARDIEMMPQQWDLAYFGHSLMNLSTPLVTRIKLLSYYPIAYMLGSAEKNPATIQRIYRRSLNERWMYAGWFNDAHAYAINSVAGDYLQSLQRSVWLEADVALNHLVRFSGLTAITQRHILFEQNRQLPSQIGARPSWT